MLSPPAQFRQMWVAQWGSSMMIAALWWLFAKLRTPDPWVAAYAALAGGAAAFAWFSWVAWRSGFGSLHGLLTPPVLAALFFWPASQALLPAIGLSEGQVFAADAMSLAWHCIVLALAAFWHWRAITLPVQGDSADLEWPGVRVALRKRVLRPAASSGRFDWVSPGIAALVAIPAYAIFKNVIDLPSRPAGAAVMFTAISTWFYLGYLGRMWGQAFRLRAIEKSTPGPRFTHERYKWLLAERGKRWLGRMLQKSG
jgi:hypothetical protein